MDSSGFRSSLNVQDRRGEQGANALLFRALQDKLMDPATPARERAAIHQRLSGLISFEWQPGDGFLQGPGFQGGDLNADGWSRGPLHIGAPEEPPVSPIHAAMGVSPAQPFVNPAVDMRAEGLFGELSDMIQKPRSSDPSPQDLAAALMRR